MLCKICEKDFNNSGGQFTKHLKSHNISLKQYVINTKYNGVAPKCKCGLCEEEPIFFRGDFKKFAKDHNTYKIMEQNYIKKYGVPVCECDAPVSFTRGKPNKFCSFACSGKSVGFGNNKTKNRIKEVLRKKYNVEHVSQIPYVKENIGIKMKERWARGEIVMDEDWKNNIGEASKRLWAVPEYREKVVRAVKISLQSNEIRQHRSLLMKDRWFNDRKQMLQTLANCFKKKSSNLHIKIRDALQLSQYGFKSEVVIGKYIVDEANLDKKIIIEVFGDYVHANPMLYDAKFLVRLPGCSYLAEDKWKYDANRITYLAHKGFDILILWENDNFKERFEKVKGKINDSFSR